MRALLLAMLLISSAACAHATIEPGHRGLLFAPDQGGLQREILVPGRYPVGGSSHIDDFDVTYTTQHEEVLTFTRERHPVGVRVAVIYRPIISELYQLDSEIGPSYYEEVVGPEFRSVARLVIARHALLDLPSNADAVETDMEQMLRQRVAGKHVEIASVVIEKVDYSPRALQAITAT